mgnify:CR=1 FL=1
MSADDLLKQLQRHNALQLILTLNPRYSLTATESCEIHHTNNTRQASSQCPNWRVTRF